MTIKIMGLHTLLFVCIFAFNTICGFLQVVQFQQVEQDVKAIVLLSVRAGVSFLTFKMENTGITMAISVSR